MSKDEKTNDEQKKPETKDGQKRFCFSEHNIVVRAKDLTEAREKLAKILKKEE